jgi:hypothetical protein
MAVASLNRIWDQQWAMINRLHQLGKSNMAHRLTTKIVTRAPQDVPPGTTKDDMETKQTSHQVRHDYLPKGSSGITLELTTCRLLGPTGMVGGVDGPLVTHAYLP